MNLEYLKNTDKFYNGLQQLFKNLNIPVNYIDDKPASAQDILKSNYKPTNESHKLIKDIFILGMVDDAAFKGEKSVELSYIKNDYEGILIFGVELKNRSNGLLPSRGQLAEITRAFNREFKHLPVVVVYRYDSYITIANAERMKYDQKWREGEKIGKVILIKDINVEKTHRAHIDILEDLKVKAKVNDFKSLNEHWLKVLNSSELNKKFYQELSNWYFWALDNVSFPDDIEKNKDVRNATNLIRLITRVIFIWFIKEKDLVPESLFDEEYISKILKEYKKDKSSVYYQAILQNLFFGTLNQKMNERKFAQNGDIAVNKKEYGIKNLCRYQEMFNIPEKDVVKLFEDIPFLNGGLFDCLDKMDGDGVTLYMDGFSRNPKKRAQVQDFLFFSGETEYDLNKIYDTKNKNYTVRGLINILNSYKFTIAENTPIEEEVALDPELLGKVFENLLASYNPETQTTARKQTGSFYTPREIVNYMVDESLKEYLKQNLKDKAKMTNEDSEVGLEIIFNYVEKDHAYTDEERKVLINAIDNCKILDPACGSGAFPMGVLHKLVYILHKLDPNNELWKDRQIEKINVDDPNLKEKMVADVNEAFMNNELDFGRKLYLIENCIYGVDIQPIAIQISKLRFFISLIVDQKVDKTKENLGIRSLPNLETKFVAANTLIGLDKPQQPTLPNQNMLLLEEQLKENRHNYFSANTRKLKLECQKKDKELREEISKLLEEEGWSHKTAEQVMQYDPYDQNVSSMWFDYEWMFGIKDGFDAIIGNPPYVGEKGNKEIFHQIKMGTLRSYYNTKMDLFYFFFHHAIMSLKNNGTVNLITTNYYPTADGAFKLRKHISEVMQIQSILNFNEFKVFDSALGQHNMITFLKKSRQDIKTFLIDVMIKNESSLDTLIKILNGNDENTNYDYFEKDKIFEGDKFYMRINQSNSENNEVIYKKIKSNSYLLANIADINSGCDITISRITQKHIEQFPREEYKKNEGVFVLNNSEVKELKKNLNDYEYSLIKPYLKNSNISKYTHTYSDEYLLYIDWNVNQNAIPNILKHLKRFKPILDDQKIRYEEANWPWYSLHRPRENSIFESSKKIIVPYRSQNNSFAISEYPAYASRDVFYITVGTNSDEYPMELLAAILNSKLIFFWLYNKGKRKGDTLELYATPLSEIPIPKNVTNKTSKIINLVNLITSNKKDNSAFEAMYYENQIDVLIYKLYNLDYDEVKVIDPEIEKIISREKYEKMEV